MLDCHHHRRRRSLQQSFLFQIRSRKMRAPVADAIGVSFLGCVTPTARRFLGIVSNPAVGRSLISFTEAARSMGADCAQEPFRQRFCRARGCGARFFLCRACDRGHCYCSAACRARTRAEQRRSARRRHQRSAPGRLDHRDRQRAYRRRLARRRHLQAASAELPVNPPDPVSGQENVTDHPSQAALVSGIVRPPAWRWPAVAQSRLADFGALVCRWCGRVGRWLNPFAHAG